MKQVTVCGMAACEHPMEENAMWGTYGNYMLVGFTKIKRIIKGVEYFINVPVWRKWRKV